MEQFNIWHTVVGWHRFWRHALYWLLVWLSAPYFLVDPEQSVTEALLYRGVNIPVKMLATYILVYYQYPRLFKRGRYVWFTIHFLLSTYLFTLLYRLNNVYVAEWLAGEPGPRESLWQMVQEFEFTYFGYLLPLYFFTFVFWFLKLMRDNLLEARKMEALTKEKARAELNFLKAQIHPHFLFNTLNNLYALTISKSDEAPDVVARLSEMLRYMLYKCQADRVLVSDEVALLRDYTALESLRYGDRLKLSFDVEVDDKGAQVAPLILISIVENAFKHGVSGALKEPEVKINLRVTGGGLFFRVFNTKAREAQKDDTGYKEGVGVNNIRRQLDLVYAGRYRWEVAEEPETYEVRLELQLV